MDTDTMETEGQTGSDRGSESYSKYHTLNLQIPRAADEYDFDCRLLACPFQTTQIHSSSLFILYY